MITKRVGALSCVLLVGVVTLVSACGTTAKTKSTAPIPIGILYGFSGRTAFYGQYVDNGVIAAIQDINNHGGVLGRPLTLYTADTSSDVVDATPALRELLTHNPVFMVGPSSIEFSAVRPLIDQAGIPDFTFATSTASDNLHDKWVYRVQPPDSQQSKAMAYYAIKKGWTHCSILMENDEAGQSLVPPLVHAYTSHGGTILSNIALVQDQSSYRSELAQAFAKHPQCVFTQEDQQTAGTLFSDAAELGDASVPYIGTNIFADPTFPPAIGLAEASKWVTTMGNVTPSGPSFSYFSKIYAGQFHGTTPNVVEAAAYDATVVAALAMTKAGTTDRQIWVKKITDVSNPPGTVATNYAAGIKLLKEGKKINYEGASGPMNFDSTHSVTAGWVVEQFDPTGQTLHVVFTIPAISLGKF